MKRTILLLSCMLVLLTCVHAHIPDDLSKTFADGDLTGMTISDDSDNIYVTVFGTLTTNFALHIDIDNNPHTGYGEGSWTDMGADYEVGNAYINRYSGTGGAWGFTYVADVTVVNTTATERLITIPKSAIDAPGVGAGSTVNFGYANLEDVTFNLLDFFPDTESMHSYVLTADPGHAGISLSSDADSLYVTLQGSNLDPTFNLFINADGDGANGFQFWGTPTSSGAEYYISVWGPEFNAGGVYSYTGTSGGADWSWAWINNIVIHRNVTNEVTVAIDLDLITVTGTDISAAYNGASSNTILPSGGSFEAFSTDTHVWGGSTWSNGTPSSTDVARIDVDYNAGSLTTADLIVGVGATVTINSNETLTVNGDLVVDGAITIKSGGSLITYDANSIGGNAITFERNTRYSDGRYSFVGSPVLQHTSLTGSDLGANIYSYNETTAFDADAGLSRWEDASADQLVPGVGYTQSSQKALSFVGTPNSGTITVTGLSHTVPSVGTTATAQRGWNLVSNPYPAAIDVTEFLDDNTNITGSVYLWDDHGSDGGRGDDGDYLSANAIGVVPGPNGGSFNGYIGSSQGFFVQVMAETANTSIVFEEDQRVLGSNGDTNFFRQNGESDQVSVKLALNGDFYNALLLGFREDATLGYDRLYDAKKLIGNGNIAFYSLLNNEKYAIQGLPALTGSTSIPLGYDLAESGTYSLETVEVTNLPDNYDLIVSDLRSGEEFILTAGEPIQLNLMAGANLSHLTLEMRRSSVLDLEASVQSPFNVYSSGEFLNIELDRDDFKTADIRVFDMAGSLVISLEDQVFTGKKWSFPVRLSENRIYVAHVSYGDQIVTKKFLK